jgi:hypothetical protein
MAVKVSLDSHSEGLKIAIVISCVLLELLKRNIKFVTVASDNITTNECHQAFVV